MKKFKCMNIGNCDNANTGKVFELAEGEELVCPKCGSTMLVEAGGGVNKKLIGIIAAAILVLAGAGIAIWKLTGGQEIAKIKLAPESISLTIGGKSQEQVKANVIDKDGKEIKDSKVTYQWTSEDETIATVSQAGEVKAVKKGKTVITVKIEGNDKVPAARCEVKVKEVMIPGSDRKPGEGATSQQQKEEPKVVPPTKPDPKPEPTPGPTTGTLKLSYGTYTGQIKNGYPNGQGRLKYSTSRQINKNDSKGRTANAGDVVQGTFVNGFFTIGKHFDSAGNLIESINVGVVDGQYESK